ncbi:hypothetical protein [Streptomyces sp. AK04-3B]|uniref:hypothetical protein n=1 Tax=Streptomyces sp. AK04-3B TaxID=3028650 RepID=UPI0029B88018|nr:hypothetical protein [Streptomyces sp. AK04-3B]MDX3798556.1 hypothetical protein [Streptomyces sp. AK04-3B]
MNAAQVEVISQVRVGSGRPVERLACHPRLPLVAGWDSERPAVHVWACEAGRLRELASIGAESSAYGDSIGWDRARRTPAAAWHPDLPLLVVAGEDHVLQWTPAGLSAPDGIPAAARYRSLAFSPDGRTLWASPSSNSDADSAWESSDVIDLVSGTVSTGPRWDTGVAEHPAGGLLATLASDQGATFGLFARVDQENPAAVMRVLRRALILDADGYETPVFSTDGRHLAIRGDAYGNSLQVFEFPSLHRVLATALGDPSPGYPYPQEWLDQMRAWSRHNIAFAPHAAVLWVGTPTGSLIEVDLETRQAVEHDVLAGLPVTALGTTATGGLVIAGGAGDLALVSVPVACAEPLDTGADTSTAAVAAFLEATSVIPDDGDLESHLVVTDGARTWGPDDLEAVTTATSTDPSWLQLKAAINHMHVQDGEPRAPA